MMNAACRMSSKMIQKFAQRNPITSQPFSTLKFSPTHEYAKIDGDTATIGITDHAASALGDVVFVDLPSIGAKFSAGESFGSVESVKAASDVYAPVEGEVVAINSELESTPGKVNDSPLEKGWFIKLKVSEIGKADFGRMLDEAAYKKHCDDEKH